LASDAWLPMCVERSVSMSGRPQSDLPARQRQAVVAPPVRSPAAPQAQLARPAIHPPVVEAFSRAAYPRPRNHHGNSPVSLCRHGQPPQPPEHCHYCFALRGSELEGWLNEPLSAGQATGYARAS
jgi:hypothetical protein